MSLSKKGLRKIEHCGQEYGWMILKRPTYTQAAFRSNMTVAIQLLNTEKPKVLHVTLNIDRPDNWLEPHQTQITPRIIEGIISGAIEDGWVPDSGGAAYEFSYQVIKYA
ncbi:hypothetical protein [Microbulbifer elongatus]|uniref:hypothetical protein n=1 Tax=Microbulbifer elongatus TaxID=86173 RepID=UPI001CFE9632|nr:hypothetical protein [Microbulbifer elongatus]